MHCVIRRSLTAVNGNCLFIFVSIQLIRIHINITESEHTCTKFTQLQIQSNVYT